MRMVAVMDEPDVLIVASPPVAVPARRILEACGVRTRCVSDGAAGLAYAVEHQPSIIVVELAVCDAATLEEIINASPDDLWCRAASTIPPPGLPANVEVVASIDRDTIEAVHELCLEHAANAEDGAPRVLSSVPHS